MFCALQARSSPAALVALARDCSPRIEVVGPGLVVFDARGLGRLLGDARQIAAACARMAEERQLSIALAIAGTRTAALLLALARPTGVTVVAAGEEAAAVAPLPVALLMELAQAEAPARVTPGARRARRRPGGRGSGRHYRLAPIPGGAAPPPAAVAGDIDGLADFLEMLRRWGLGTLGALAALPAIDLFERAGTRGLAWQGMARGEDVRPLVCTREEAPYEASQAFEWPLETLDPLAFAISRLLEPLTERLARAELGTTAIQVTLRLVTRELHVRRLALPSPMRNARMLRTLARLDLESHPPAAAVDALTITLAPAPGRRVQHSLLTRALPVPEQMATLTARLTAVLGAGRVGAPRLVDTHRPGAFAMRPFDGEVRPSTVVVERHPDGGPAREPAASPARSAAQVAFAWRRWRGPRVVHVDERRGRPCRVAGLGGGLRGGRVVQAAGPWRSAGEWWRSPGTKDEGRRTREGPGTKDEGRRTREGAGTKDEGREPREEQEQGARTRAAASVWHAEPDVWSEEPKTPWDHDEWDIVLESGLVLCLARDRLSGEWRALALAD